jgi:hypothetical protein
VRQTSKAVLTELAERVYSTIYDMTPTQRRRALRTLDGLTTTNCGWTVFNMREVLRTFIFMATPQRRKRDVK